MKRIEIAGHARYLTFSCYRRLPLLANDAIRQLLVDQLAHVQRQLRFDVLAWVVMPEHVHLLVLPYPPAVTVTRIANALKRPVARRVLARWRQLDAAALKRVVDAKGQSHFWQAGGGYDRNIFTQDELVEKVEYIHNNPVRRGLVATPADWAWSSMRRYEGLTEGGPELARDLLW